MSTSASRPHGLEPFGLLLSGRRGAAYLGVCQTAFYELAQEPDFPKPVDVPGRLPRWRREDLRAWVRGLRPVERRG